MLSCKHYCNSVHGNNLLWIITACAIRALWTKRRSALIFFPTRFPLAAAHYVVNNHTFLVTRRLLVFLPHFSRPFSSAPWHFARSGVSTGVAHHTFCRAICGTPRKMLAYQSHQAKLSLRNFMRLWDVDLRRYFSVCFHSLWSGPVWRTFSLILRLFYKLLKSVVARQPKKRMFRKSSISVGG